MNTYQLVSLRFNKISFKIQGLVKSLWKWEPKTKYLTAALQCNMYKYKYMYYKYMYI